MTFLDLNEEKALPCTIEFENKFTESLQSTPEYTATLYDAGSERIIRRIRTDNNSETSKSTQFEENSIPDNVLGSSNSSRREARDHLEHNCILCGKDNEVSVQGRPLSRLGHMVDNASVN